MAGGLSRDGLGHLRSYAVEAELLAEVELSFTAGGARSALAWLRPCHGHWLRVEDAVVTLASEHLLTVACAKMLLLLGHLML